MSEQKNRFKVVWGAVERGGKTFWTRVGLGWEAQNGVVYAHLDAYPRSGRLAIKEAPEEAIALSVSLIEEAAQ